MSTPAQALAALAAPDQARQGRAHTPETGEITAERLADVEAHAVTVRAWNPDLIPGLLQTTRYAAAVITSARPSLPPEDAQRHAHLRAARVDRFLDRWGARPANEAWFAVGERAVRRPLLYRSAHHAQLRQLACLADLPNVHLHVVPEGRSVPGSPGQLAMYGLEPAHGGEQGARLGYVETPVGAWYTLRAADIARLHTVFAAIIEAALDTDDTRSLIQEALAHE